MSDLGQPRGRTSRRSFIGAGLGALSAPWVARFADAKVGDFDWRRYKGEHLEVFLGKAPLSDFLQQHEKEFEELTGISVGSEQIPEQQARQKQVIEFNSGKTSFDVTMVSYHVQKRLFGNAKWLVDLREFIGDPKMTNADFDFADFTPGAIQYARQSDGRLDTLPIWPEYFILYWNKELFQARGVAYPQSFAEILEVARALHDPKAGVAGFLSRGLKNANVPVWTTFLLGYGVDPIDKDLTLHTDGAEALAAARIYQTLNKDFGPAGVTGFNWYECQSTFALGKGAMWLDALGFALPLQDPKKSRVVGKVGYGVMPAGPKAQHASLFGVGLGISSTTDKRGPAWYYCQWATGKLNARRLLEGGVCPPARQSAYDLAAGFKNERVPSEWLNAMRASAKIARPCLPDIVGVTEFREIYGVALTNMITGADPQNELRKATEQFKPVLARTEKS